jgi:DNA/RNA endonuclease YhcR with UshA esterase domain
MAKRETILKIAVKLLVMILLAVGEAPPAAAHHAFLAEYDRNRPVTLKGEVTAIDWVNPHSTLYLDVRGSNGEVTNWAMEGFPPRRLIREGWTLDILKPGDTITIQGYAAHDGSARAHGHRVEFPDGQRLYFGVEVGRGR